MKNLFLVFLFFNFPLAMASVDLGHAAGWKFQLNGLAELGLTQDSRPSFLESAGSHPISGPDTPTGPRDRKLISVRHSRLGFTAFLPDHSEWPAKFYVEFDFMGNRNNWPLFGAADVYYTEPSFRFRHYYFTVEHAGWKLLAGQSWSLFGWQPTYRTATVSVSPGPGVLSQRHRQFTLIKTYGDDTQPMWQIGLSFGSASSKAGGIPNIDFGIRYANPKRKGLFASATGSVKKESFSIGLSGTYRKFGFGALNATSESLHKTSAYAGAVNFLLPLVPQTDSHAHGLTFTGEFSMGTGYGGALSGWSGNLPLFPHSAETTETLLAKGYGGFDAQGKFHLFRLRTWSSQLQYHFPERFFATIGYSQLSALNVAGLGPVPTGFTSYDRVDMSFVNLMHDFSEQLRGALEYSYFTTNYTDGSHDFSSRYQMSLFYRF